MKNEKWVLVAKVEAQRVESRNKDLDPIRENEGSQHMGGLMHSPTGKRGVVIKSGGEEV